MLFIFFYVWNNSHKNYLFLESLIELVYKLSGMSPLKDRSLVTYSITFIVTETFGFLPLTSPSVNMGIYIFLKSHSFLLYFQT